VNVSCFGHNAFLAIAAGYICVCTSSLGVVVFKTWQMGTLGAGEASCFCSHGDCLNFSIKLCCFFLPIFKLYKNDFGK
jgi:hypothetical protein